MIRLVTLFLFFMSTVAQAADWRNLSPGPLVVDYDHTGLQTLIGSKDKTTDILKSYYNQVYGIGFLHIGHMADSGHGHFLKDKSGKVVSILYHTREIPARLSIEDQDALNEENRNWIQSLEAPYTVVNALPLIYDNVDDYPGLPADQRFNDMSKSETWKFFISNYSVGAEMLDPEKIGMKVEEDYDNNFRFIRVDCKDLATNTNLIKIFDDSSNSICLTVHVNINSDQRDYLYDSRGPLLSSEIISD